MDTMEKNLENTPEETREIEAPENEAAAEEDFENELPELQRKGQWRFQNRRAFFTYKEWHDHDILMDFFARKFNNKTITFFRSARETGDKQHPYRHTHALVEWSGIVQTTNPRFFDIELKKMHEKHLVMVTCDTIHPHIRLVKTEQHFFNCKVYLGKEDQANEDLKELKASFAYRLQQCKSEKDVVFSVSRPGDIPGALVAYNLLRQDNRVKCALGPEHFRRWQVGRWKWLNKQLNRVFVPNEVPDLPIKEWRQLVDGELKWAKIPGDKVDRRGRNVNVFWGPNGGDGKSIWAKVVTATLPTKVIVVNGIPPSYHLATFLQTAVKNGWDGSVIIFNLTRTVADCKKTMMASLEMAIDGLVTALKYMGGVVSYEPKAIILLTNFIPDLRTMSPDRWRVWYIESRESEAVKLTPEEFWGAFQLQEERLLEEAQCIARGEVPLPRRPVIPFSSGNVLDGEDPRGWLSVFDCLALRHGNVSSETIQ